MTPNERTAFANKLEELAKNIQLFFDSGTVSPGALEGYEGQELMNIQFDICEVYQELTGKNIF